MIDNLNSVNLDKKEESKLPYVQSTNNIKRLFKRVYVDDKNEEKEQEIRDCEMLTIDLLSNSYFDEATCPLNLPIFSPKSSPLTKKHD